MLNCVPPVLNFAKFNIKDLSFILFLSKKLIPSPPASDVKSTSTQSSGTGYCPVFVICTKILNLWCPVF